MRLTFRPILTLALTVTGWAQGVLAPHQHGPAIIRQRHDTTATSTNWSGYAVAGLNGTVTDAKGSWIVPSVTCPTGNTSYASFWVGIDGWESNTVEQIGTDSDCSSGTPIYYAWYEFYPHFAYYVPNMTAISAGDVMSAEVSYSRGTFTVTITDKPIRGKTKTYTTSRKMGNAKRSSAEWIIEAPYSGGVLPLADFGTVSFGEDNTGVADTCYATLAGNTLPIGSLFPLEITMITKDDTVKSQPSALSKDGTSFTDTWASAGP